MKVSEPALIYGNCCDNLQALKQRLVMAIDECSDAEKLQECLETLAPTMPCMFTEEELDEEIKLSEASGVASDEKVTAIFAKWGVYR